ncbi:MAG TPA: ABC transporter permease [Thermoplasmata archaeon]|nr:ABC transporter permease [Thermoplasmata archaeon]
MNKATKFILKCAVNSLITVILVIMLNFLLFRMMPGDPINYMISNNPRIGDEYKERLIDDFDLDAPMSVQFVTYIKSCLTLNFGDSFIERNTPAMDIVMDYMKWTLILTGTSSVFMIVIGMVIGILGAAKRGGRFDTSTLTFSLVFYAMPTFWLAMILIAFFAKYFSWFPSSQAMTTGVSLDFTWPAISDMLWHLVLPAVSLTLVSIAAFVLIMRGALTDVMTEEYITTARAKGLSKSKVLKDHAVPNAMLPMVSLIAISIAFIVGGAFQAEWVFSYPGIGWRTITATYDMDYPVLQAAFFLITLAVIVANFIADILLMYMDPRIKMEAS